MTDRRLVHVRNTRVRRDAKREFLIWRLVMWWFIVFAGLLLGWALGTNGGNGWLHLVAGLSGWCCLRLANGCRRRSTLAHHEAHSDGVVVQWLSSEEAHERIPEV